MTRITQRRCDHCKVPYLYQMSGYPDPTLKGDARHCGLCLEAINAVLKTIPEKYSIKWMNIEEETSIFRGITTETLLKWEAEWEKQNEGKLVGQQVFAGLFDTQTNEYQNWRAIRGRDRYAQYKFRLGTWKGGKSSIFRKKKPDVIEVEMEWDNQSKCWTGAAW